MDLDAERGNGDFVRGLITTGAVTACHDISDGGLLVAVAEMALASGIGADITPPAETDDIPLHGWAFGEDQGRYIVTARDGARVLAAAEKAGIPAVAIGATVADETLKMAGNGTISLTELQEPYEGWLPAYMAGPAQTSG